MAGRGGPLSRLDSIGFSALAHSDSLGRNDANFFLPEIGETPRAGGFGLTRQLSFDPLRTMDLSLSGFPSSPAAGKAPEALGARPRRGHGAEEPSHGARAVHGVRTHAQFKKPERSGAVKVRVPEVPTPTTAFAACLPGSAPRHARRPARAGPASLRAGSASARAGGTPDPCACCARRSARSRVPVRRATQLSASEVPLSEMKHADHRRLLSRWGKALFRFVGIKRDDFARRTGCGAALGAKSACKGSALGAPLHDDTARRADAIPPPLTARSSYRENFLHVLTVCFGTTFEGPGAWWYDHSHAGAFAAALLYCATSGRVRVDESETANLFTKKEPERAASSWTVNEAQLLAWGVAPAELASLFRGEARTDESGFPRGTPLIVPAPHELPPPAPASANANAAATAAGAAVLAASGFRLPAPPLPPPLVSNGGSGAFFMSSPPPSRSGSDMAALLQQVPCMPLPFSTTPLVRQNTVATLAILMCQSEYLERAAGRPLDRTFSDGARALMASLAAQGALAADQMDAGPVPQLGSAAPAWARHAAA
jgi:hypothetical protein